MVRKLDAKCPECGGVVPVVVGRKSTVRRSVCSGGGCSTRYDYSAWQLSRSKDGLKTFYRVDLVRLTD